MKIVDPLKEERELLKLILAGRKKEAKELSDRQAEEDRKKAASIVKRISHGPPKSGL